jgi:hypothetical protein
VQGPDDSQFCFVVFDAVMYLSEKNDTYLLHLLNHLVECNDLAISDPQDIVGADTAFRSEAQEQQDEQR